MFLRLSNVIINVHKISKIQINTNQYYVYLQNYSSNGSLFFSLGSFSGSNDMLFIEKEKNPTDYEIITRWIEKEMNHEQV